MRSAIQAELEARGLNVTASQNAIMVSAPDYSGLSVEASVNLMADPVRGPAYFEYMVKAAEDPSAKSVSRLEQIGKMIKKYWLVVGCGGYMYYSVYDTLSHILGTQREFLERALGNGLRQFYAGAINKEQLGEFATRVVKDTERSRLKWQIAAIATCAAITGYLYYCVRAVNKHYAKLEAKQAKKDAKKLAKRQAREQQTKALAQEAQKLAQVAKQLEHKAA